MKNSQHLIHSLDIIKDCDTEILILGAFPSRISRSENFYYMNKYNRFFKMLSAVYQDDFYNVNIYEKIALLKKHHLGLYDVIVECDIINSSDASIKNPKVLDIYKILKETKIKKIILNGTKAYSLFIKAYPELSAISYYLPSTSPANAKVSLEEIINTYQEILYK